MSEQPAADVRTKVRSLPTTAGVYLMKDALGRVIYVGKAVNLRGRVSSYFNSKAAFDRRISDLVPEIRDVDHIGCDSEVEALLLEARLIKDIQPRFNSELKDDKTFPYLQITTREEFPRIEFTRKPRTRGAKLYGPFTSTNGCTARSASCSVSFGFARVRSTSPRGKNAGDGSGRACWRASGNALLRAICGSAKRTTAVTSAGFVWFWTARRANCSEN